MERGAQLLWCSVFPGEKEVVYPPLTFLKCTSPVPQRIGPSGAEFKVVRLEPAIG